MRSKAIFMALLALAFQAQARSVLQSEAAAVARAWAVRGQHLGVALGRDVQSLARHQVENENGSATFYSVKLSGGGTVFTSGDTETEPIIAFTSQDDDFSTIDPKSPLWALLNRDLVRRTSVGLPTVERSLALERNRRKWAELVAADAENPRVVPGRLLFAAAQKADPGDLRVPALMKTQWSQSGGIWNYYTPGKAVCGCVATATAQLMRYLHGTPDEEGAGGLEIPFPKEDVAKETFKCQYKGKDIDLTLQGGTYCWTNMPFTQGEIETEEQKQNIGKLTSDVGISAHMMYDEPSGAGSGAVYFDAVSSLVSVFGYRQVSWCSDYMNGLDLESETGLKFLGKTMFANFDARRPCLVEIPGHAIAADGYGFEGDVPYVHLNFGWAGQSDLWYNLPDMTKAGKEYTTVYAVGYNIFPDAGEIVEESSTTHGILSGRVLDDDGKPVSGCAVTVSVTAENGGGIVTNLVTDAHGIWAAILPADTYDVEAATSDREWIGAAEGVTLCAPEVKPTADAPGNAWGNDIELKRPSVRLNGDDKETFSSVDRAVTRAHEIAVADPGVPVTFEIIDRTMLKRDAIIDFDCLFVATNACAAQTPVDCLNDATLFVTNGTAFFSNVVFTAGAAAPVTAAAPARVRVAGTAWFGEITSETPGIAYDSPSCFVLGGELENAIVLSCPAARGADCKFGVYDCAATVATNAARRLLCAGDIELAGRVDAGDLRWEADAPVDPQAAVAYVAGADPAGNVYYRSLDKLLDQQHENVRVAVARPDVSLEKTHVLANVEIRGEGDGASVSAGPSAGLKVTNGELTVSGLTFADYHGDGLLVADGSGATLTVSNAVFSGIEGTNYHSGAVVSLDGSTVKVGGGVTFSNCRASGVYKAWVLNYWKEKTVQSYGGAIYVGPGGTLALDATDGPISITDCSAASGGGGVYAKQATVTVAGNLTVSGNWRDVNVSDDLWLPDSDLRCTGDLTSAPQSVGIFSGTKGEVFASCDDGATNKVTRKAFFCDSDATLAAVLEGASNLVWSDVVDKSVDEAEAVCCVSGVGGASGVYYATLEDAFAALVDGATLTLFANTNFTGDVYVSNKVTVVSKDPSVPVTVSSLGKARIFVLGDGAVTLTNVVFDGQAGEGGLFKVDGGSLTLAAGATVCNVIGVEGRGSGAVHVYNGGTVTMKSGSEISDCWNLFADVGSGGSYGGALLVEDDSQANLFGGQISGCCARAAGGVFVGTRSTVRLAGDMTITGNADADGRESNLYVSDDSELILTGAEAFGGAIGATTGYQAETNVFGRIENLAGDIQAAAHAFTNDVTHDVGMAVANGTEKLLVWSSALDAAGQYVDADGKKYELADGAPAELAEPQVETGLVYDGTEKVGLKEGIGYVRTSGYLGTNAGPYQATATLRPGFVWMSPDAPNVWTGSWAIAQCTLTITNYVTFTDAKHVYDEQPKTIAIDGVLPAGVRVAYFAADDTPWPEKGVWQVGSYEITAKFTCDDPNYVLDRTELKATLTIEKGSEPPDPPPGPDPVQPTPIAFQSIEKVDATTWALVITNRVPFCNYRLLYTDDLSKGFVHTGAWEQAAADADPVWTTNVVIEGVNWFWKAEAKEGVKSAQ